MNRCAPDLRVFFGRATNFVEISSIFQYTRLVPE